MKNKRIAKKPTRQKRSERRSLRNAPKLPTKGHRIEFEQLLDDAIFGVKIKNKAD